jgi:hypothetical protein
VGIRKPVLLLALCVVPASCLYAQSERKPEVFVGYSNLQADTFTGIHTSNLYNRTALHGFDTEVTVFPRDKFGLSGNFSFNENRASNGFLGVGVGSDGVEAFFWGDGLREDRHLLSDGRAQCQICLVKALAAFYENSGRQGARTLRCFIASDNRTGQPESGSDGPSWLTFLGHAKDSLWSLDLFCCESIMLRTHWVLVVMDHHTRRISDSESMPAW